MFKNVKKLSTSLAATFVHPFFIRLAKFTNCIHLHAEEIFCIASVIKNKRPCRFLVFGFGNDSSYWVRLNRGGKTIFIEDNPDWYSFVLQQHPDYLGYLVDYGTRRTQWQELLDAPEKLKIDLPVEVISQPYDCILVDGPQGWLDSNPGRMKSIFTASRLVAEEGDIFVHDCDRIIESTYCERYLGSGWLVDQIRRLRHYHFPAVGMR
jgi:hypothetical protein